MNDSDTNIFKRFENVPQIVRDTERWLLWRGEYRGGRPSKIPYCNVSEKAAVNNSSTWNTFAGVMKIFKLNPSSFDGIGFVLGDGITGIDLDHVIDDADNLDPKAAQIVSEIPGYVERSPSGTGLHILAKGLLPDRNERAGTKFGPYEFYDESSPRYLTVTGNVWQNRSQINDADASEAIKSVYRRFANEHAETKIRGRGRRKAIKTNDESGQSAVRRPERPMPMSHTNETSGGVSAIEPDDELPIQKIKESKQGEKFSALFEDGNLTKYGYKSPSEGLMALLLILAWWTDKDEARMDRIFRQSALYDADKWNRQQNGETLGSVEIKKACEIYSDSIEKYKRKDISEEASVKMIELARTTGLPVIRRNDKQLLEAINEVIDAIKQYDPHLLYIRDGRLVRIDVNGDEFYEIIVMDNDKLMVLMSKAANFVQIRDSKMTNEYPRPDLVRAILAYGNECPFPPLKGLVMTPVIREDGTILNEPGYDKKSGLYFKSLGPVPSMPDNPTQDDAKNALKLVLELIHDFPFVDESSRDNEIGLLLTLVVKPLVGLVPLALIDAPTQGTGKGMLALLASILATGRESQSVSTEVRDEEEWRKRITSTLLGDRPVVIIDNVEGIIRSAQLAAVLTSLEWEDRLLGSSENVRVKNNCVWIATGNNIQLGGDIPRRSFWIRINSNTASPWMRDPKHFKHELPSWAIENRMQIIVALLTMARAWYVAGCPEWSGRPLGSFEKWSKIIGGILEYAGRTHFLGNLNELYAQIDEEKPQWNAFVEGLFEVFGNDTVFSAKDIVDKINKEAVPAVPSFGLDIPGILPSPDTPLRSISLKDVLPGKLGEFTDRGFAKKLGLALGKNKDKLFDTSKGLLKLAESGYNTHTKVKQWKLSFADSAGTAGSLNLPTGKFFNNLSPLPSHPSCGYTGEEGENLNRPNILPAHSALPAGEKDFLDELDDSWIPQNPYDIMETPFEKY